MAKETNKSTTSLPVTSLVLNIDVDRCPFRGECQRRAFDLAVEFGLKAGLPAEFEKHAARLFAKLMGTDAPAATEAAVTTEVAASEAGR